MTFHYSTGLNMDSFGFIPHEPHITCDGCGVRVSVVRRDGRGYYAWFRRNEPPPRWERTPWDKNREPPRLHFCPSCVVAGKMKEAPSPKGKRNLSIMTTHELRLAMPDTPPGTRVLVVREEHPPLVARFGGPTVCFSRFWVHIADDTTHDFYRNCVWLLPDEEGKSAG